MSLSVLDSVDGVLLMLNAGTLEYIPRKPQTFVVNTAAKGGGTTILAKSPSI